MKDKLTIGLFIDTYYPMIDGVISVVDNYAKRLAKYGDVIVFAPQIPGKKFDDSKLGYKIIRCKSVNMPVVDYSLPIPKLDKKFLKELKRCNLDIVHIHSPFTIGKIGINYAKKRNIPVIATMHSQFKQDFLRATKNKWLANLLTKVVIKQFNRCDECWAVNSEIARIFYEDYHYKKMPEVMNNATEMKHLENIEEANDVINTKHNIDKNEKVFLFVGRINALKNIFFLVESLKIIKKTSPNLKFKMLFVGGGQDEKELEKWIKTNNMEKEIILCGKVTDRNLLAMYYTRADLFLFPSLYDASSIVQIEAASQKTPTLFIEGAATTATITNGVNGFISKNDENEYAKNILEIINNKELYTKISDNCYKDLYINWDIAIKEVYNRYSKIYNDKVK